MCGLKAGADLSVFFYMMTTLVSKLVVVSAAPFLHQSPSSSDLNSRQEFSTDKADPIATLLCMSETCDIHNALGQTIATLDCTWAMCQTLLQNSKHEAQPVFISMTSQRESTRKPSFQPSSEISSDLYSEEVPNQDVTSRTPSIFNDIQDGYVMKGESKSKRMDTSSKLRRRKRWIWADHLQVCIAQKCQGLQEVHFYQCVYKKCIGHD